MKKGCVFYFLGTKWGKFNCKPKIKYKILTRQLFQYPRVQFLFVCCFLRKDIASLVTNWKKSRGSCLSDKLAKKGTKSLLERYAKAFVLFAWTITSFRAFCHDKRFLLLEIVQRSFLRSIHLIPVLNLREPRYLALRLDRQSTWAKSIPQAFDREIPEPNRG